MNGEFRHHSIAMDYRCWKLKVKERDYHPPLSGSPLPHLIHLVLFYLDIVFINLFGMCRILSEYLGLDTMLALVCKTYEGIKALEMYDNEGCIKKTSGLHGLGTSIGRALEGRFQVICLENLRYVSYRLSLLWQSEQVLMCKLYYFGCAIKRFFVVLQTICW